MQLLPFLFLMLSLTGCSLPDWMAPYPPWEMVPPPAPAIHHEEATAIVQEMASELLHEKRLHLERSMTCYDEEGIHTIQMEFITQNLYELCDARKLIVDITETMLAKLNQDSILGPEFANFPIKPSNLEIYITCESFFGKYVDMSYVMWICLENSEVSFYTFDLDYKQNRCWHAKHEAYATSREIVLYERQAEDKYNEEHPRKPSAFGQDRYYPEDSR